jgi:DNA-directed RNA polymerase subunit RPC12/RpoP
MAREIACPSCGETDDLRGNQLPEGIRITCGACGTEWTRDDVPERCTTCSGTDLVKRPLALTQYSRGTQLSIVGIGEIILCARCDAEMVDWSNGRAVPASYRSAALERKDEGPQHAKGPVRITP